jgi:hypothetical protein
MPYPSFRVHEHSSKADTSSVVMKAPDNPAPGFLLLLKQGKQGIIAEKVCQNQGLFTSPSGDAGQPFAFFRNMGYTYFN